MSSNTTFAANHTARLNRSVRRANRPSKLGRESPHVVLLALALVLPRAAAQRFPCAKRRDVPVSNVAFAKRKRRPKPDAAAGHKPDATPLLHSAGPTATGGGARNEPLDDLYERKGGALRGAAVELDGKRYGGAHVGGLVAAALGSHQTRKTAAVRARRADQATAIRASATSEFTGPRCGRGSRAPCRARPSGRQNKTTAVGLYVIWNCSIYTWIQLQLGKLYRLPFS